MTVKKHARVSFNVSLAELEVLRTAARDAHMKLEAYCRLMVLCAAGMGGVIEHLERATEASWKAGE